MKRSLLFLILLISLVQFEVLTHPRPGEGHWRGRRAICKRLRLEGRRRYRCFRWFRSEGTWIRRRGICYCHRRDDDNDAGEGEGENPDNGTEDDGDLSDETDPGQDVR